MLKQLQYLVKPLIKKSLLGGQYCICKLCEVVVIFPRNRIYFHFAHLHFLKVNRLVFAWIGNAENF